MSHPQDTCAWPECGDLVFIRDNAVITDHGVYHPQCHDAKVARDESLRSETARAGEARADVTVQPPHGDVPRAVSATMRTPATLQEAHQALVDAGTAWDDAAELARLVTSNQWSPSVKLGALQQYRLEGRLGMGPDACQRFVLRFGGA